MKSSRLLCFAALLGAFLLAPCSLLRAATNGAGAGIVDDYTTRVVLGQGTSVTFSANNAAAGTTGTETAITLRKSSGTGATTSAASFVVSSGKRFRITSITFGSKGNATGTIQSTVFSLRLNTAGAVTTTSTPIILSANTATPATGGAYDRITVPVPEGLEILGDGTLQIGVTAAATYVTNAPTWDVLITGYEY